MELISLSVTYVSLGSDEIHSGTSMWLRFITMAMLRSRSTSSFEYSVMASPLLPVVGTVCATESYRESSSTTTSARDSPLRTGPSRSSDAVNVLHD